MKIERRNNFIVKKFSCKSKLALFIKIYTT
jgi:hypothetical protein